MWIESQEMTVYNPWGHPSELWPKNAFSKIVLGWSPLPIQHKNYQVDSDDNNLGESNMIQEKVIF